MEAAEREVEELTVEGTEEEEEEGREDVEEAVVGDGEGIAEVSGATVWRSGVFKTFVQHFIRVHISRILSCDSFFLVIDFITSRLDDQKFICWCNSVLSTLQDSAAGKVVEKVTRQEGGARDWEAEWIGNGHRYQLK